VPEEIIKFCKLIEPSFAGINLEDISAPRCFEILERLEKELAIPVFHDDQDGTAIVVLAALINACRVTGKVMKDLRVVINGAGAAGIAITRLLLKQGVKDVILLDSSGTIYEGRIDMNSYKVEIAKKTNKQKIKGGLCEAMVGADVFIGVSKPNVVHPDMIRSMKPEPIIFPMANPTPEIMPDLAYAAGASIVGTGRSDLPNQINNALVFPGIFRGLLDGNVKKVTDEMKQTAAIAIAYSVKPKKDKLLPLIFDKKVVRAIAKSINKK
jgi:malate dehydrogenase (oxaloacetate-decarboxylating)